MTTPPVGADTEAPGIFPSVEHEAAAGAPTPDYLRDGRGVWSWLYTTDNKRIAIMV
jgi:hypothetical protein